MKSSPRCGKPWPVASPRCTWSAAFILRSRRNGISNLLTRLRALDPQLQLKAFTAIEIRHLARRIFKTSIAETLPFCARPASVHLRGAGRRFSIRRCVMNCAGERRAPRNGLRCIGPGTRWVAAAPARCSTDTSRPPNIGSIICGNCASCRMKREASPDSFLSLSSPEKAPSFPIFQRATAFRSAAQPRRQPHLSR